MHLLANSEDSWSDCSKGHSCICYWRKEKLLCCIRSKARFSSGSTEEKILKQKKIFAPVFWVPHIWVLLHKINDHDWCSKGGLKKLLSPQSPPPRGGTHYVIEIFNSFFFKFDASSYVPFILSDLDSLSTAVLLIMSDPQALVPWESERAHGATDVLFNILGLQYSDTKCRLWYCLRLAYS